MAPKGSKEGMNKVKKKKQSIKQRIRSIKRLLSKADLPATVRVSQERMLEFMQSKLHEEQKFKKDNKMIKKYKMVKFFEKRKLWRQHRAVVKELNSSPDCQRAKELEQLEKKVLQHMNYVEYFPSDIKYISLFPAEPYTNDDIIAKQEELHQHINEKVDAGKLPQAMFNCYNKETNTMKMKSKERNETLKGHDHMDRRKASCSKTTSSSGLEKDEFFIDTCGNPANIE